MVKKRQVKMIINNAAIPIKPFGRTGDCDPIQQHGDRARRHDRMGQIICCQVQSPHGKAGPRSIRAIAARISEQSPFEKQPQGRTMRHISQSGRRQAHAQRHAPVRIQHMPPTDRHHRKAHGPLKHGRSTIFTKNIAKNGIAVTGDLVGCLALFRSIVQIGLFKARQCFQRIGLRITSKPPRADGGRQKVHRLGATNDPMAQNGPIQPRQGEPFRTARCADHQLDARSSRPPSLRISRRAWWPARILSSLKSFFDISPILFCLLEPFRQPVMPYAKSAPCSKHGRAIILHTLFPGVVSARTHLQISSRYL